MKNILIYSDIHICLSSIEECNLIFDEIIELCNAHSIDTIISLGDNFDCNKPSALELNCLGNFVKKLGDRKIILLSAQSHESETMELSSVDIYGILKDTITVVKEYQDENHLYCGHFIVSESQLNKFGATISKNQLKKYRHVILGHGHSFELIKPNVCQLGSCRWVDFSEAQDKQKVILLIHDYDTDKPKCSFIALKSPYPMIDIELQQKIDPNQQTDPIKDPTEAIKVVPTNPQGANPSVKMTDVGQLTIFLDQLPEKTKIRIIFKNYSLWVNFLPFIIKYKNKFNSFKLKNEFIINSDTINHKKENKSMKDILINWLEKNKVPIEIQKILKEELE